jgi:nitrite reductase/ring-hydroxylating ferredoxin subunit
MVEGDETPLAIFRGQYSVVDDGCTLRGGLFSEGTLGDGAITCPWHFGQFILVTGQALSPLPTTPLRIHAVGLEYGSVLVSKPR